MKKQDYTNWQNVTALEHTIQILKSQGPAYAPSSPDINLNTLQIKLESLKEAIELCWNAQKHLRSLQAERKAAHKKLKRLSSQIIYMMQAQGYSKEALTIPRDLQRKLQGNHGRKKTRTEDGTEPRKIKTSKQSYDAQLELFNKLLLFLESINFKTKTTELQLVNLWATYEYFLNLSRKVYAAQSQQVQTIRYRNFHLYHPIAGVYRLLLRVRAHFKARHPRTSLLYKAIVKTPLVRKKFKGNLSTIPQLPIPQSSSITEVSTPTQAETTKTDKNLKKKDVLNLTNYNATPEVLECKTRTPKDYNFMHHASKFTTTRSHAYWLLQHKDKYHNPRNHPN